MNNKFIEVYGDYKEALNYDDCTDGSADMMWSGYWDSLEKSGLKGTQVEVSYQPIGWDYKPLGDLVTIKGEATEVMKTLGEKRVYKWQIKEVK